jgi:hypothetical protein
MYGLSFLKGTDNTNYFIVFAVTSSGVVDNGPSTNTTGIDLLNVEQQLQSGRFEFYHSSIQLDPASSLSREYGAGNIIPLSTFESDADGIAAAPSFATNTMPNIIRDIEDNQQPAVVDRNTCLPLSPSHSKTQSGTGFRGSAVRSKHGQTENYLCPYY